MILNNGNLAIEGARIVFRNFEGRQDNYNNLGDRNFAVVIDDPDTAEQLRANSWNVKTWGPKDDPDAVVMYIKVNVSYKFTAPIIDLIGSRNTQSLNEDTAGIADRANFTSIDLEIYPSHWIMNGREGVTGYLVSFYGTIAEDYFGAK